MKDVPRLWHIIGPGSIGSLFGWYLDKAGFSTRFITRTGSESGRLISLLENGQTATQGFLTDHSNQPISRLLVTVKAQQTEAALVSIKHRLTSESTIILLQNGMGTWDIAQQLIPNVPCLVGTTTEGANRTSDQHLVHAGRGQTWIGAMKLSEAIKAQTITQELQSIELPISYDTQIYQRLWLKLAINCAINPLTVLYDCQNGHLLELAQAREQMQIICDEVTQVMKKVAVTPPPNLYEIVCEVAKKTATNVSSMLQDYRRGYTTEIDFITGYLVEQAAKHKVSVPQNSTILDAIHQLYH